MKYVLSLVFVLLLLFSGTPARAAWSTNMWIASGGYSGNYNDPAHFSPAVPGPTDVVLFTNQQGTAYTVTFQQNATNGVMHVGTDKVTYNMNGHFWYLLPDATAPGVWYGGYAVPSCPAIAAEAGEVATVTLSSSSPGTNTVTWDGYTRCGWIGNASGSATLNINTNLGYGARLWIALSPYYRGINHATINVSGPGAVWQDDATYGGTAISTLNIANGGKVDNSVNGNITFFSGGGGNTVNVNNAGILLTKDIQISYFSPGGVWKITGGGIWNGRDVDVANLTVYPNHAVIPWDGDLLVDDSASTATVRSLRIGYDASPSYYPANARVTVQNGATLSVSSNILVSVYTAGPTNTLILNGATIRLGDGAYGGALTNKGIMQAAGSIIGLGSGVCQVWNDGQMIVGSSIGTLAITNGNFTSTSSGSIAFEFGVLTSDRISISGGTATIGGTNTFAPLGLTPKRSLGAAWDFVRADDITYTATDNMAALMTSYGLVEGADYTFGIVPYGSGKALRLKIVGPPGTLIEVQ